MMNLILRGELARKRWRRFKARKTAILAVWLILLLGFFSLTAELWSNSKPIVMSYQGKIYLPVLKFYHPENFGRSDILQMDYRQLQLSESDWAIWPLVKWDPLERDEGLSEALNAPTSLHIFGTDDRGRDVFSRLLYGFRYSMAYALLVWAITSLIGITAGAVMGFMGGWIDLIGQRIIEVVESLPWLLILITIVSIFSPDLWLFVVFTAMLGWVNTSLYVRGEFLKLRRREFVEAARALGASRLRLIFSHVLPNSLTPWITISPFLISGSVAGLAALDFLGFGLKAPTPSWGELLSQAKSNVTIAWWLAVFPSSALFSTLVLLNMIGEGVRDAFDPRKT